MQERLVRKLDLEIALSKVKPHPSPDAYLEQYTIPTEVASQMLHLAAYKHNDVLNKSIVDLGCGTGRLGIGSAILGAKRVIGVDIDRIATGIAAKTAKELCVKEKTQWLTADIASINGSFDTVLQNPPFGVQRRRADSNFLKKALEIGNRIYSLHKSLDEKHGFSCSKSKRGKREVQFRPAPAVPFLKRFVEQHGGKIQASYTIPMAIPHLFRFHRKPSYQVLANLIVVDAGKACKVQSQCWPQDQEV